MKKSTRVFLAALTVWLCGICPAGAQTPQTKPKDSDIPGCATMPPKIATESLPAAPAKRGSVKLGVWIKADGSVEDAEFIDGTTSWKDACIAAAKKIKFEPVMWEGTAIPARTELTYNFQGQYVLTSVMPLPSLPGEIHTEEEWGVTKPVIEVDPTLVLPLIVRSRRMYTIEAGLNYVINEEGATEKIELLGGSSEGAVRAALDMISERKYQPAKVRETPVKFVSKQILSFQSLEKPFEALAGAVDIVDPAFPYERLLAGEDGHAVVKFTLSGEGRVVSTELVEASHPDFGGSLVAAVESWIFKPEAAVESGTTREYRHDFVRSFTPYAAQRLIEDVRAGKVVSNSPAGLDARPKVLARPGLAYPTALFNELVAGTAEVEFVVDRVGLAQLPRVVKASRPEFGWAAVTLANGMRFQPLTRGGKPAELRVRVPINFNPPKPEAAAAAPAAPTGG